MTRCRFPVRVLCACLIGLSQTAAGQDRGLYVAGRRLQAVAIAPGSSPDARWAATQLQTYLEQRVGDKLDIVETATELRTPAAYVGVPSWLAVRRAKPPKLSREGVCLVAEPGALFLIGGGERGAIYAALVFLERYTGVRWYQPEPWGTEVPTQAPLRLEPFRYTHEPSFWFRDITVCLHPTITDWAIRNRLNTNLRQFSEGKGGTEAHAIGGHAFTKYVKPAYFESHPEYFPIKDGQRYLPRENRYGKRRVQACTTHPEVLGLFTRAMRRGLDRLPDRRFVSISPDDVTGRWCSCPTCCALDTGERMVLHGREQRVVSDRFFTFANELADRLGRTHPHARITTFAYHQYRPAPRRIKVRPNVVAMLCQPGAYNHPIASEASEQIREYQANLLDWTRAGAGLILYRYMFKTMWESLPYPRHRVLAEDLKYIHRLGLAGEHGQSQGKNWGMLGLNWYVHAQLLWDVNQDADALIEDYYTGYFREARGPMRAYFELMAGAFRNADGPIGEYRLISPKIYADRFLKPELMARARGLLDAATQAAQSPRVKRRVRMVEIPFRYAEHYMAGLHAYKRFDNTDQEADLRAAIAEYEAAAVAAQEGEALWAMAYSFREGARRWLTEREIPQLTDRLRSEFGWRHSTIAEVPLVWKFAFERAADGEKLGWFRPDFDDRSWRDVQVHRTWQQQGLAPRGFKGAGWYRVWVDVPEGEELGRSSLHLGGMDASGKVWVNGSFAGEHKYVPDESWRTPYTVAVARLIRPGRNCIAVRVYTGGGNGGLYRRVRLIAESQIVLLRPEDKAAWDRPKAALKGPDWEVLGSIATIRTGTTRAPNPHDGSWIEFPFHTAEAKPYQVWLRVVQHQPEEAKAVTIDGQPVGLMHSQPRADAKGYTQFHKVGRPVLLDAGDHKLRIVCTGIRGWIDPISAVLLSPDLDKDYEALQTEHTSGSVPRVNPQ